MASSFKIAVMNRKLSAVVAGLLLLAGAAEARLGETLAQCEERYGPVVEKKPASLKESDPDACVFSKSGITTLVEFRSGVAWRIVFRMMGMTPTESETLLKANMPEGGWGAALKINGQDYRLSADRRRVAVYSPTKADGEVTTLEIASRDYGVANYAAYSARISAATGNIQERKSGSKLQGF